jgi:hypothetical protein
MYLTVRLPPRKAKSTLGDGANEARVLSDINDLEMATWDGQ